jgi:hypothetical protein
MMNKEDRLKLAKDDRFISGIYNYCDRWCERCAFTSRCMNFAMANEHFPDQESRDIRNEAFWRRLSQVFQITFDLVKELAEREGIDLDAIDVEMHAGQEALHDELARTHKCCRMGMAYSEKVDNWFDAVKEFFGKRENAMDAEMQAAMPSRDLLGLNASCEEAFDVIRWYQHQIYAKLMRAVRGTLEEEDESFDAFAKDSDGSAKVALMGIERSIGAWGELRRLFFEYEAEILDILLHLEGLRRSVEEAFPAAKDFVRPGFDRVHLNS